MDLPTIIALLAFGGVISTVIALLIINKKKGDCSPFFVFLKIKVKL